MGGLGKVLASLAAAGVLLAPAASHAQSAAPLLANRDYLRIEPRQPSAQEGRIEVVEFFYYGCPVCYELEPILTRWLGNAPADVVVRRVPALATASWESFARLYYTLEALGEVARLHWPVYEMFHFEGVNLGEEAAMLDWVSKNGIDRARFLEAYGSPAVQAKIVEAREMTRRYGVTGVPGIAVDGKYLTSARLAGSTRGLMPLVDQLIELARKDRAK